MSIYRSEAVLTNTSIRTVNIGSLTIDPGSSVIFWNTQGTTVSTVVFGNFSVLRANREELMTQVESGDLIVVNDGITLTFDQFTTVFRDMCEGVDKATDLNQLMFPIKQAPVQSDGTPLVAHQPRVGSDWVIGTHNFADSCTWFQDSTRVNGEVLTTLNRLTFMSVNPIWIDMTSGRMHNENFWISYQKSTNPADPHGYKPVVYVDGVKKVMRANFETSGGDYEIHWESGEIVFFERQDGVVTADYSYPTTSYFHAGTRSMSKNLILEDAEVDISMDTVMTDEFIYSWWAMDPGSGQWFEMGSYSYKRVSQLATEARGSYPVFEATGCAADVKTLGLGEFRRKSRGMRAGRQAAPFNYSTIRVLPPGVELRIYTKKHRAMGGEHLSVTLFCTESDVS